MPPSKKSPKSTAASRPTPVSSTRHHATRANIPTEELRDFVADDEKAPKTVLYPRDPSLDPQLVWKGKDEQDQQDPAVPAPNWPRSNLPRFAAPAPRPVHLQAA